jgi:ABC-type multidrug transport system fused ATPase/permease subunit
MMIRGYEIGARAIVLTLIGLMLVAAFVFGTNQCSQRRNQAAQSRVERSQAEAASNSAADAIDTVAASGKAEAASEDMTRNNDKEIRNAEGASDAVNPAVRDAGLRSLCRRPAYRNAPPR